MVYFDEVSRHICLKDKCTQNHMINKRSHVFTSQSSKDVLDACLELHASLNGFIITQVRSQLDWSTICYNTYIN
jgi:hypothetical protein